MISSRLRRIRERERVFYPYMAKRETEKVVSGLLVFNGGYLEVRIWGEIASFLGRSDLILSPWVPLWVPVPVLIHLVLASASAVSMEMGYTVIVNQDHHYLQ